jgi:hypothetical protein
MTGVKYIIPHDYAGRKAAEWIADAITLRIHNSSRQSDGG